MVEIMVVFGGGGGHVILNASKTYMYGTQHLCQQFGMGND